MTTTELVSNDVETSYRVMDLRAATSTDFGHPDWSDRFRQDLEVNAPDPLSAEFAKFAEDASEWASLSVGAASNAWPEE